MLLLLFTGKHANGQNEPNTCSFEDAYMNTIKIMDVTSLPKELDTNFFKNSFHGHLFSDSTHNMYITINEITAKKRGVYDVRLTIVIKDATIKQMMEQYGHKHYTLEYKKSAIRGFNYSYSDI
jgi:hypothetical protein